jgi:hypothetical protein
MNFLGGVFCLSFFPLFPLPLRIYFIMSQAIAIYFQIIFDIFYLQSRCLLLGLFWKYIGNLFEK